MARKLSSEKALVIGIDLKAYLAALARDDGDCVYTVSDIESLKVSRCSARPAAAPIGRRSSPASAPAAPWRWQSPHSRRSDHRPDARGRFRRGYRPDEAALALRPKKFEKATAWSTADRWRLTRPGNRKSLPVCVARRARARCRLSQPSIRTSKSRRATKTSMPTLRHDRRVHPAGGRREQPVRAPPDRSRCEGQPAIPWR